MSRKLMTYFFPVLLFLSGCATTSGVAQGNYITGDPALKDAAVRLVQDYLNGQSNGDGYDAASRYGRGVRVFSNLEQFSLESVSEESGIPCINIRVKAGNQTGGVFWESHLIRLDYFPQLRAQGDFYLGLRIKDFGSPGHQFMKGFRSNF